MKMRSAWSGWVVYAQNRVLALVVRRHLPGCLRGGKIGRVMWCALFLGVVWFGVGQERGWAGTMPTVTTSGDSGRGSLREAISSAGNNDIIQFDAGLAGQTITLTSAINAGSKNLTFSAASGTVTLAGAALQGAGTLTITGSNHFHFTNDVNLTNGLTAAPGSSADITLADYAGGRVMLGAAGSTNLYSGTFSGKLNVQGQHRTNVTSSYGGGVCAYLAGGKSMSILEDSLVKHNIFEIHATTGTSRAYAGGIYVNGDMSLLSGETSGNAAKATSGSSFAYAYGGGTYVQKTLDMFAGTTSSNMATAQGATFAWAYGGGAYIHDSLNTLSGMVSDNTATATAEAGRAYAHGGGLFVNKSVSELGGAISGNKAIIDSAATDYAYAYGGGAYIKENLTTLSGEIRGNTAKASSANEAHAHGGGASIQGVLANLSGTISGNTAEVTGGAGLASALGGGIFAVRPNILISAGTYTDNKVIATGRHTLAQGGALFLNTDKQAALLTLDPTAGDITFSGNTVTNNGSTTPNAIHFGRWWSSTNDSAANAALTIQDSDNTGNLITIADGITTDINQGKTFTLTQTGGEFLWGGTNRFDSEGGSTVQLPGGLMRLSNDFSLERGYIHFMDSRPIAFNVSGGNLRSEGAAANFANTALSVTSGGKLTVDLGSILTLDANSTFAMNGGTLSIGVGASNASGKIISRNTAAAPSFSGGNTLDISDWIRGTYTVLTADTAMAAGAPGTFTTFTVGGNSIDPATMNISAALANSDKDLQITASLARDNKEVIWGGTSGTWNYTNQNWLNNGVSCLFLPGDAALFNSTSNQSITLGGTSISLSGMKVTGAADHSFSGAALHIDSSAAQNLIDPGYAGNLVHEGTGTLLLATGSAANPNRIAGDVSVTAGTLALADGFALTNTDAGGIVFINAEAATPALDVRGAATLKNMSLQLVAGASELRLTGPNSALTLNGPATSYLGQGILDVDLNRSKALAALAITGGGDLSLDQSILRLRHTGLTSDAGTWLLVDGTYSGQFDAADIATATLTGTLNYAANQILFNGAYTVAGVQFPGFSELSPNAQQAWTGFRDVFYNGRTPFMNALDQAYGSPSAFQADLPRILSTNYPEGTAARGYSTLTIHNHFAGFAVGTALPGDAGVYSLGAARPDGFLPVSDAGRRVAAGSDAAYARLVDCELRPGFALWASYFGDFARQDSKDGYAGYHADHNGFALGGSKDFSPNFSAGVYGGYSHGDTRYSDIRTDITDDTGHFGAYARYRSGNGFRSTLDLAYSYSSNDSRRWVSDILGNHRNDGSFGQHVYGGGLELAYDWRPAVDAALLITPFLAGRYSHLKQKGYRESGDYAQNVGGASANSFTTSLGATVARDFVAGSGTVVTPKLTAGWLRQWGDDHVAVNSSFVNSPVVFSARSVKQSRDALLLGAGLDVLVKRAKNWDMTVSAGYNAAIRRDGLDQGVFAGVGVRF